MTDRDAYAFEIDLEKLKLYKRLSPEERFLWLEEAHEFVSNIVSVDKIKNCKQYLKKTGDMPTFDAKKL